MPHCLITMGLLMRQYLVAGLAMCLLWAGAGPAAQQAQQPVFRKDVTLIEIDAVVRDEHGKPVRGLTAADFVVKDRGVVQPIETFEEVTPLAAIEDMSPLPLT